jgi:hydroxypyruvate reductase
MAELKQLARQIFHETLAAINIPAAMQRKLWRDGTILHCGDELVVELSGFSRVCVVAIGKAAHAMVEGLAPVMAGFGGGAGMKVGGIVSAPTAPVKGVDGLKYFIGGHPIPNQASLDAGRAILDELKSCDERTLVFFLLSGGGSALVELPIDTAATLEDVQGLYSALVTCGAPIADLGKVRRHLSAVKGGRLAAAAGRATKITLAVSDVPARHEAALASGPTIPDPTTIDDALQVIAKYDLRRRLPRRICEWIDAGKMGETPKSGEAAFFNAHFSLLLGMVDLFHPAHRAAEGLGFITCCDNSTDDWPVVDAAEFLLKQLEEFSAMHGGRRVALIADGEVVSPVTGPGIGGRNSAFVLACSGRIAGRRIAVLSAGTDGIDGNSFAAGAVADGETLARASELGMDAGEFFRASDAFTFFSRLDDAVVTGPTGNNLRDLRVLLAE